jgi:hypothetical protein
LPPADFLPGIGIERGTATRTATPLSGSVAQFAEPRATAARSSPAGRLIATSLPAQTPRVIRYCSRPSSPARLLDAQRQRLRRRLGQRLGQARADADEVRLNTKIGLERMRMSMLDFHAALPLRRSPGGSPKCWNSSLTFEVPATCTATWSAWLLMPIRSGPPNTRPLISGAVMLDSVSNSSAH